jgi:hypothetical protein
MKQLKTMELGGNNNANTYFRKNGYNMNNMSQLKEKYTSRQAKQYRTQLEKQVEAAMKEDEAGGVAKVETGVVAPAAVAGEEVRTTLAPSHSTVRSTVPKHPEYMYI